jgi:predicted dehydrogenase
MINVGQIGLGYWGINILRNLVASKDCTLKVACDLDQKRLQEIKCQFPGINLTDNFDSVFSDKEIDALFISTPGETHYKLAKKALNANKHVFVEKPITLSSTEAKELIELAEQKNLKLMVGHLLLYHPVIKAMKRELDAGSIGRVLYLYFQRTNMGKVRSHENVLWSLAPHDISVALHLVGRRPSSVNARGAKLLQQDIADVAFASLDFGDGLIAFIHNSWLDPVKARKITVVGEKGILIADETAKADKLRLLKKFISLDGTKSTFSYHDNGAVSVSYDDIEPLQNECHHFFECIEKNQDPLTNGRNGLEVLEILEAAQASMDDLRKPVEIK